MAFEYTSAPDNQAPQLQQIVDPEVDNYFSRISFDDATAYDYLVNFRGLRPDVMASTILALTASEPDPNSTADVLGSHKDGVITLVTSNILAHSVSTDFLDKKHPVVKGRDAAGFDRIVGRLMSYTCLEQLEHLIEAQNPLVAETNERIRNYWRQRITNAAEYYDIDAAKRGGGLLRFRRTPREAELGYYTRSSITNRVQRAAAKGPHDLFTVQVDPTITNIAFDTINAQ